MQVPSTQIFTDSMAENKKIREEIALLKQEKELLRREVEQYESTVAAIKKEWGSSFDLSQIRDKALETIRHGLRKDIEVLKTVKDSHEQEVTFKKSKKENLENRLVEATAVLSEYSVALEVIKNQIVAKTDELNLLQANVTRQSEGLISQINDLKRQRDEAKQKLDSYNNEYNQKITQILKEENRLANKADDLHIYETRLRAKWSQVFPETEMIL